MKASLTAEGSYLFPFCFLIIGIVCYLGIFEYNQAVLKVTGYECIFETMESSGETVWEEELIRNAERAAEARTIGAEKLQVSVNITSTKIKLTYACIQKLFQTPIKVTVVYERTFPERTLRTLRDNAGGNR